MSKFGACVDSTLTWIGNNKLTTFLGLVAFSLMVSTWTLAAINVKLNEEIDNLTPAASTSAPSVTTTTTTETPITGPTEAPVTTAPPPGRKEQLRLSEHVIPVHYDLFLHPDLVTGIFSGKVVITLDIQQPTDEIILHSHLLNITFVQFTAPDTTTLLLDHQLLTAEEQLKVILNKVVPIYNDYKLEIDFEGWMTGKNIGLYRSVYKDPKGLERSRSRLLTILCFGDVIKEHSKLEINF